MRRSLKCKEKGLISKFHLTKYAIIIQLHHNIPTQTKFEITKDWKVTACLEILPLKCSFMHMISKIRSNTVACSISSTFITVLRLSVQSKTYNPRSTRRFFCQSFPSLAYESMRRTQKRLCVWALYRTGRLLVRMSTLSPRWEGTREATVKLQHHLLSNI